VADLNKYLGGGGKTVKLHEQREQVRAASAEELQEVLEDVQGELFNLRTQAMMEQVPNPMRIRQVRKLVARIHTELAARSQAA
jgi:large subunit ribosomal protein L29